LQVTSAEDGAGWLAFFRDLTKQKITHQPSNTTPADLTQHRPVHAERSGAFGVILRLPSLRARHVSARGQGVVAVFASESLGQGGGAAGWSAVSSTGSTGFACRC
jgi:hypothetical protein